MNWTHGVHQSMDWVSFFFILLKYNNRYCHIEKEKKNTTSKFWRGLLYAEIIDNLLLHRMTARTKINSYQNGKEFFRLHPKEFSKILDYMIFK